MGVGLGCFGISGRLGISAGSEECKYSARDSKRIHGLLRAQQCGEHRRATFATRGTRGTSRLCRICQASWTWRRGASEPFQFRRANGNTVEEHLDSKIWQNDIEA